MHGADDEVGNYLAFGVGNYLTPPLGNCLTLEGLRVGNYLALDTKSGKCYPRCYRACSGKRYRGCYPTS